MYYLRLALLVRRLCRQSFDLFKQQAVPRHTHTHMADVSLLGPGDDQWDTFRIVAILLGVVLVCLNVLVASLCSLGAKQRLVRILDESSLVIVCVSLCVLNAAAILVVTPTTFLVCELRWILALLGATVFFFLQLGRLSRIRRIFKAVGNDFDVHSSTFWSSHQTVYGVCAGGSLGGIVFVVCRFLVDHDLNPDTWTRRFHQLGLAGGDLDWEGYRTCPPTTARKVIWLLVVVFVAVMVVVSMIRAKALLARGFIGYYNETARIFQSSLASLTCWFVVLFAWVLHNESISRDLDSYGQTLLPPYDSLPAPRLVVFLFIVCHSVSALLFLQGPILAYLFRPDGWETPPKAATRFFRDQHVRRLKRQREQSQLGIRLNPLLSWDCLSDSVIRIDPDLVRLSSAATRRTDHPVMASVPVPGYGPGVPFFDERGGSMSSDSRHYRRDDHVTFHLSA